MELRQQLNLTKCSIVTRDWYPKDPEPTTVLVVEAPLTTVIADVLKCRAMAFNLNDEPNRFEGGFGLEHEVSDVEIKVSTPNGALVSLYPTVVKKFRIGHDAKDNLTITLRAHFSGYSAAITEWCEETNCREFEFSLLALQGNLFDEPAKVDGPDGGKRVDMTPVAKVLDEIDAHADATAETAVLASVVTMGGSHQKGTRNRPPRDRQREAFADGSGEQLQ
jgi:hypothetical protein